MRHSRSPWVWTRRAPMSMALGFVTTVTVAWLIALSVPLSQGPFVRGARVLRREEGTGFLEVCRNSAFGSLFVEASAWSPDDIAGPQSVENSQASPEVLAVGLRESNFITRVLAGTPTSPRLCIEARGWPWLCLWSDVWFEYDDARGWTSKPTLARFRGAVPV